MELQMADIAIKSNGKIPHSSMYASTTQIDNQQITHTNDVTDIPIIDNDNSHNFLTTGKYTSNKSSTTVFDDLIDVQLNFNKCDQEITRKNIADQANTRSNGAINIATTRAKSLLAQQKEVNDNREKEGKELNTLTKKKTRHGIFGLIFLTIAIVKRLSKSPLVKKLVAKAMRFVMTFAPVPGSRTALLALKIEKAAIKAHKVIKAVKTKIIKLARKIAKFTNKVIKKVVILIKDIAGFILKMKIRGLGLSGAVQYKQALQMEKAAKSGDMDRVRKIASGESESRIVSLVTGSLQLATTGFSMKNVAQDFKKNLGKIEAKLVTQEAEILKTADESLKKASASAHLKGSSGIKQLGAEKVAIIKARNEATKAVRAAIAKEKRILTLNLLKHTTTATVSTFTAVETITADVVSIEAEKARKSGDKEKAEKLEKLSNRFSQGLVVSGINSIIEHSDHLSDKTKERLKGVITLTMNLVSMAAVIHITTNIIPSSTKASTVTTLLNKTIGFVSNVEAVMLCAQFASAHLTNLGQKLSERQKQALEELLLNLDITKSKLNTWLKSRNKDYQRLEQLMADEIDNFTNAGKELEESLNQFIELLAK